MDIKNKIKALQASEVVATIDIVFDYPTIEKMELGILGFIKAINDNNCDCYVLNLRGPAGGAIELAIKGYQNDVFKSLREQDYDIDYTLTNDNCKKENDKDGYVYLCGDGFTINFSQYEMI